jgi:hypothetical protein
MKHLLHHHTRLIPMCEHGCRASHNEGHDGPNIRPKQLRNREVPPVAPELQRRQMGRKHQVKADAPKPRANSVYPNPRTTKWFQMVTRGKFGLRSCPSPNASPGKPHPQSASPSSALGAEEGVGGGGDSSTCCGEDEPAHPPAEQAVACTNAETGRNHNSGRAEPGRQTRPSVVLSRSDEADGPSSG